MVEHDDFVGALDRSQTVRDHEGCALVTLREELVEGLLDHALRLVVESRGGLGCGTNVVILSLNNLAIV